MSQTDLDAVGEAFAPFALNHLALARRQRREEVVEAGKSAVLPVELLVVAQEEAALAEQVPFRLRHEGGVHRRRLAQLAQLDQSLRQRRLRGAHRLIGCDQQAAAAGRRERHRHLELGIIAAAGALIGVRPAGIEYVFAARMGFQVARHDADDGAVGGFGNEMLRLPAGARGRRFGIFERRQEGVAGEGIGPAGHIAAAGAAIPVSRRDLGHPW